MAKGNAEDLKKIVSVLEDMENDLIKAYVKKTGRSYAEIKALMTEDKFINARTAKELGFIDEIQGSDNIENLKPILYLNLNSDKMKEKVKIKSLFDEIKSVFQNFSENAIETEGEPKKDGESATDPKEGGDIESLKKENEMLKAENEALKSKIEDLNMQLEALKQELDNKNALVNNTKEKIATLENLIKQEFSAFESKKFIDQAKSKQTIEKMAENERAALDRILKS
jgi:chromosome segregation ATPase